MYLLNVGLDVYFVCLQINEQVNLQWLLVSERGGRGRRERERETSHYLKAVRVREVENDDHGRSPSWHQSGGSRRDYVDISRDDIENNISIDAQERD
jgi:hypothetical protein